MPMLPQPPGGGQPPPVPHPFDQLLAPSEIRAALTPLVGDFDAVLALVEAMEPSDARAALHQRLGLYLDSLATVLGRRLPKMWGRT